MRKLTPIVYVFLLFILIGGSGSSCKKEVPREQVWFDFLVPITVAPLKDTISVGEELTFSTLFSDSVYDMKSAKRYYLPNFNWRPMIFIKKLVAPEKYYSAQFRAGSKFEYINVVGSFTRVDDIAANMTYVYENNQYKLTVKIKPKEKGVFTVAFSNDFDPNSVNLPQEFAPSSPSLTKEPVIGNMRNQINNGQTNYHILKQHCKVEGPEVVGETNIWMYKNSTYTFVVK
jgi:hypothetical protein